MGGKLVGPRTKRSGAARTSRWDALRLHPSLTTVTQVIPIGKLGGAMTKRVVLHQRAEGLPEVSWQRQQALCTVPCSDRAHPKYTTGGAHLLLSVVGCLGGQYRESRFLFAPALKRDINQGISRRITWLLSEGKDTPRCERDIFYRVGPAS